MRANTSAPYFSGDSVAHRLWKAAASTSRIVRPTSNSSWRSRNGTSGRPADTSAQARAVSASRPDTQPAGTARRGACSGWAGSDSPPIIEYAAAAVATSGAIGPSVSSERLRGITPIVSMLPSAGLKPTTPHSEAGTRIEPPVSLPIAQSHIRIATATAEPPDEPPAPRLGSWGLRTGPWGGWTLGTPYGSS